jgi:hypothetical protein
MLGKANILTACVPQTGNDKENCSGNEYGWKTEKGSGSGRTPARVLPTYIFSLNEDKNASSVIREKEKRTMKSVSSRNLSAKKQSFSAKKSEKAKLSLNKSVLGCKKSKKIGEKKGKPKSQFDLNKLVKAVSKHCEYCHKFKEELHKQSLFV